MKRLIHAMLLAGSFAAMAQSVVPVHEEPFHRLVAENRNFRILDILIPPGQTTLYHRHAEPALYVSLNWAPTRAQLLGGEFGSTSAAPTEAGSVMLDDNYQNDPISHRVNNTGDEGFRLFMITNNRSERNARGEDVLALMPGQPGIDSVFFAQSRVEVAPGETVDWDGVDYQVIFILATDTHVVIRSSTENSFAWGMHDPGDFEHIDTAQGLSFENRSDEPAIIIAVAVR